jgi:hypothetical protein
MLNDSLGKYLWVLAISVGATQQFLFLKHKKSLGPSCPKSLGAAPKILLYVVKVCSSAAAAAALPGL